VPSAGGLSSGPPAEARLRWLALPGQRPSMRTNPPLRVVVIAPQVYRLDGDLMVGLGEVQWHRARWLSWRTRLN
jgi:hypothetical protein